MAQRDYEKNPIVVEATVRVYIYEPIDNIEAHLERAMTTRREQAIDLVLDATGAGSAGLDEYVLRSYQFVS